MWGHLWGKLQESELHFPTVFEWLHSQFDSRRLHHFIKENAEDLGFEDFAELEPCIQSRSDALQAVG